MNLPPKLIVAAGDVGGTRALMPVLYELERRKRQFEILNHRSLAAEAPAHWCRVELPQDDVSLRLKIQTDYCAYLFGTSVSDTYPLQIARVARTVGLPVLCVLDNWMNYRKRLEMDGQPTLVPDVYAVMDQDARDEAVGDGIPLSCLRVVGQPALASLADEFLAFPAQEERERILGHSIWAVSRKKLIVFISEPAGHDQGEDACSPQYRGYTEKTVLSMLAHCLQPFHETVQVGLIPHPRENAAGLLAQWEACRGCIIGGLLAVERGRQGVFVADGVCGMASILLFEAMLLGKPTLSLQPGLRVPQLEFLRRKGMQFFVTDASAAPDTVARWMRGILALSTVNGRSRFHSQMASHRNAASLLANLIEEVGIKSNR